MTLRRTSTRLADGRELIYFDDSDRDIPKPADPRNLPDTATHSQARYDQLAREWVVIASHRQGRTFLPPAAECPLDPSRGGRHTEIPAEDYDVVVFENRFPSLSMQTTATVCDDDPLFVARPGRGRCEVVCFTSDHTSSFSKLPPQRVRTVIEVWVDRTEKLSALDGVQQVFPFENRGEEIGVTLAHPHGQIYAYPFVPTPVATMLHAAREHRERTGRCLHCDIVEDELKAADRVVVRSDHWVAFVPFAARWPYEVRLYSRRHVPDLPALSDEERSDLAAVYLDVLGGFDALFDTPTPYIAAWMQAPVRGDRDLAHLHVRVFTIRRAPGKLKYLAGSESGMNVFINDVSPEIAAEKLRTRSPA